MNIEEKEKIYFAQRKLKNVNGVLQIIKNDLINSRSAMSERIVSHALESVIDSINAIHNEIDIE